jgi:hypothetical protein
MIDNFQFKFMSRPPMGMHVLLLLLSIGLTGAYLVGERDDTIVRQREYLLKQYRNDPVYKNDETSITTASSAALTTPLIYQANPRGSDVVMGLAVYNNGYKMYYRFVKTLRATGFDGHIIIGVHTNVEPQVLEMFKKYEVTAYGVEIVTCNFDKNSNSSTGSGGGMIRSKCSIGINLNLEMGRYEMYRQWLSHCKMCTNWVLMMDIRDSFFQLNPFESISKIANSSPIDLMFIEELGKHTCIDPNPNRYFVAGNFRNRAKVEPCYGKDAITKYADRPVLCSGTIIANRAGANRFLSVLISEFIQNMNSENNNCRTTTTDQWTMNYLYYHGRFGSVNTTVTIPWGLGPVLTVGKSCITLDKKTGAEDLVPVNNDGIVNLYDDSTHGFQLAPLVHQFDRCQKWISKYIDQRIS